MKIVNVNDFEMEVLESKNPILVDFFATWCGPCQMLAPILESISKERKDFDIVKVDIDESRDLAFKYEIEAVPTMILFKNGEIVTQIQGLLDQSSLIEEIEKAL